VQGDVVDHGTAGGDGADEALCRGTGSAEHVEAQAMRRAATPRSASAVTTTGLLPPSSRVTGVRVPAAPAMILRPISVPPVNRAWSNPSDSSSWVVVPSPSMTLTASGSRYCGISRVSCRCGTALVRALVVCSPPRVRR
jgi:hypothetical protein